MPEDNLQGGWLPLRSLVTRSGARIDYLDEGTGPVTVVLLHGNPSVPWVYQSFITTAAQSGVRAIAIDWYGDSDRPWGGYNISGYADQAKELLDMLNLQRVHLAGHSLGGVTGLVFTLRYPERLSGLSLVGTGASPSGHGTIPKMLTMFAGEEPQESILRSHIAMSYGTAPEPDVQRFYVEHLTKKPMAVYAEAMRSTLDYELEGELARIDVPTQILHGSADTGRTVGHAEALHELIRDSELTFVDSGHYVMEERPEEFTSLVLDFVARRGPTTGVAP